jgi:hypothetical protein
MYIYCEKQLQNALHSVPVNLLQQYLRLDGLAGRSTLRALYFTMPFHPGHDCLSVLAYHQSCTNRAARSEHCLVAPERRFLRIHHRRCRYLGNQLPILGEFN